MTTIRRCAALFALLLGALAGLLGGGASQRPGQETQHPRHLGRRHRPVQHQRLQPRHDGLQDAQHRPHRQGRRAVHRLVRAAELHRRPRRVHHRAVADPHRPHQGRPAGRARGHEEGGPDHRHAAQGAGLHDRPVRQEPPRRPRRDAADEPRLRRVLRQPLPSQRRGRAGEPRLSEETPSSRRSSARAASSTASPTAASPTPAR